MWDVLLQRLLKMSHVNFRLAIGVHCVIRNRQLDSDGAQSTDICSTAPVCLLGNNIEIDVLCERSLPRMDLQDLLPRFFSRKADVDVCVEAAGTDERRVENVRPIGRADDEHILECFNTIHLVQQGCNDIETAILRFFARLADGVDFVEEDDARFCCACSAEYIPDSSLGLAHIHLDEFRAFDCEEVLFTLRCNGLCDQGLCATGGAIE